MGRNEKKKNFPSFKHFIDFGVVFVVISIFLYSYNNPKKILFIIFISFVFFWECHENINKAKTRGEIFSPPCELRLEFNFVNGAMQSRNLFMWFFFLLVGFAYVTFVWCQLRIIYSFTHTHDVLIGLEGKKCVKIVTSRLNILRVFYYALLWFWSLIL